MAVSVPRRLFTVDEYYRMAEAGILRPDERVELLDGEIVPMNPIGSPHAWCVKRLTSIFVAGLGDRFILSIQDPVHLDDHAEPEPDFALVQGGAPQDRHPGPAETLLIVEVADSSIHVDRGRKRRMYARASIPEYWIVDLNTERLEVYREPTRTRYRSVQLLSRGDTVSPLCAPDLAVSVAAVLGTPRTEDV